ncbi:MAG: hypothetical protein M3442_13790 [Chloroflexota bacterium]|nr:hypothetical protein [Chloroflexota bacterium]
MTSLAVARLEAWLETMRAPATRPDSPPLSPVAPVAASTGYGGPVVHWWRDSLRFCGPGCDWRYEGIILGYLALYQGTGQRRWLEKATRAGDDLVAAQSPAGNYRHSSFELNPRTAGTPHEAAADIGLLGLAAELKRQAHPSWPRYLAAAERNLRDFYIGRLWDENARRFCDNLEHTSFVPNKAATVVEALFRLADLTAEDERLERYIIPTLDAVLLHQVRGEGHSLDGGIAQNSFHGAVVEKYFPYYVARCVPALVEAARRYQDARYRLSALAAGDFLRRWRDPDGAFPQVVYPHRRVNRYPRWVGGLGDILRALDLLRPHGIEVHAEPSRRWLLSRQLASGAFRSADGFSAQVSQRPPVGPPDARDLLPVVGWADKAFRYLAGQAAEPVDHLTVAIAATEIPCLVRGRPAVYHEDESVVEITIGPAVCYRWRKGQPWAFADFQGRRA